jgi:Gly-Xaa carboxypeptidase
MIQMVNEKTPIMSSSEKSGLPLPVEQQNKTPSRAGFLTRRLASVLLLAILTLFWTRSLNHDFVRDFRPHHRPHAAASCKQPDPLFPPKDAGSLDELWAFLDTEEFKNASILRHSGAVQIPTQSFDDLGPVGEDPRWEAMYPFTVRTLSSIG